MLGRPTGERAAPRGNAGDPRKDQAVTGTLLIGRGPIVGSGCESAAFRRVARLASIACCTTSPTALYWIFSHDRVLLTMASK